MDERIECLICGEGHLKPAELEEEIYGISLGQYDGEICDNPECGETFLKPEEMRRLESRAKELKIWGLAGKAKVGKSGNSLIIRIPARLARFLDLKAGRVVSLAPEGRDKIIMETV